MKNNPLSLIALAENSDVSMLKSSKFFLVAFPFTLELLGDLLLEYESLESIVTLFLRSSKASSQTSRVILLLIDETREASVLAFVVLDLDLEILSLFGKLLGKRLEFEELIRN